MNTKLYVGNLSWSITEEELKKYFEQAGKVIMAKVILHRDTGRSRGFGFIEMASEKEAECALTQLNDTYFEGRKILIREALPEGKDKNKSASNSGNFNKTLADFINKNAKVGNTLAFSIGKKHFTLTRDIDNETSDFNESRKEEDY